MLVSLSGRETVDEEHARPVGRVFLSHTAADKPLVVRLAADLQSRNVGVWYDEWEMRVGDSLADRIQNGIEEAGFLAVVLSPRSVQSPWVRRELNAALSEELERKSVFVLPILAQDCEIPLFLRDKLYADFRYDYSDGLRAILRTVAPGFCTPPKLLFDSRIHDQKFATWGVHYSHQMVLATMSVVKDEAAHSRIVMCATQQQSVGINKSVPSLHGRAEFEYRVESCAAAGSHLYFAMIPIQETGYDRKGVIEVGGDRQADPRNPASPLRMRFSIPPEHQVDAAWHVGVIDFDFRDTPTAFYSIFAARINEGVPKPGIACLSVGRVRIYSW